jgi:hypothetical protein
MRAPSVPRSGCARESSAMIITAMITLTQPKTKIEAHIVARSVCMNTIG